jgi:hypothetical protein
MPTIHLHQTTTAKPEQFVAGLTDFGPGRSKLFGNSADKYLKVHDQGVVREAKNLNGRLLEIVLAIFGKRVLGKALGKTVKAIEARNDPARAAERTPTP